MTRKTKIIIKIAVTCFVIIALVLTGYFYYNYQNKKFEVIFFDIGQGDSALINLPGDNEILIDGGPDMKILSKLGKYLPFYNRSIELMIATHPHSDHITGLVNVLRRYEVKKVMVTGVKYDSRIYAEFLAAIKSIEKIQPYNFDRINFDGYVLEIIYPWENFDGVNFKDVNDSSIVVKLIDKNNNKFLFTGDIGIEVEKRILEKVGAKKLKANVLKVGHQGANTSSNAEFLQAVSPEWAVISVGENSYGHPSLRVIRRLERVGSKVLRTDKKGDLIFVINRTGELELH